jgi:CubicO group peptidase (beta-lactamase class C family)
MRCLVLSAIAVTLNLLAAETAYAQVQPADTAATFDQTLRTWAEKHKIEKAIIIVRHGSKIAYTARLGDADPAAPHHIFSPSKAITAACIGTLVRDKKLAFDTTIATGLARFLKAHAKLEDPRMGDITVGHLLTHRAGFSGTAETADPITDAVLKVYLEANSATETPGPQLLTAALQSKLARDPGGQFAYGNAAYTVLGAMIEEASGRPYEAYCQNQVLKPLGISAALDPNWRVMSAYGGWRMTGADYLKFLDIMEGTNPLLGAEPRNWMLEPDGKTANTDGSVWYGLGVFVRKAGTSVNIWHWGSWRYDLPKGKIGPLKTNAMTYAVRLASGSGWFVAASPSVESNEARFELDRALAATYRSVKTWD